MKNSKIDVSFEDRILSVRFLKDAVINANDLQEVYAFANQEANGKTYGVIFEALDHYEVTDDAIQFITDNPSNSNIVAKAYVINSKEAKQKTKLHLLFDHPALKPFTFSTYEEALGWLKKQFK